MFPGERKDYPPEHAAVLWQICWNDVEFTVLDAGKHSYLFGSHAIRVACAGCSAIKTFIRPGEAVAVIPTELLPQVREGLIRNLGEAHRKFYGLKVSRANAAMAIRSYRRDRESRWKKWEAENANPPQPTVNEVEA